MRFAAIARVTEERWITCMSQDNIDFGLEPGDELELETTICNEIRQHSEPVIIDNVSENKEFCTHHTPIKYGFQSYISFPIFKKNGEFFGTLCAIDPEPAKLENKETHELFKLYTELISFHLQAMEELQLTKKSLAEEKKVGKLRETFVAVLAHDLRNPLGTTRLCADILMKLDLPAFALKQVSTIKTTSLRMQELIDNLLDFAKSELGEGISLEQEINNVKLNTEITQVIREFKTTDAEHDLIYSEDITEEVLCDPYRVAQMFSNLMSNAVKHGSPDTPIIIDSFTSNGEYHLKVTNSGNIIPENKKAGLFKPFYTDKKDGLGLGLYIVSEIAEAHQGKIEVESTEKHTSFEFIMPLK
ncbi:histidine kinase [Gramella sp. AN32]|nr:histidine kinase [Gramella sp. AN32]